MAKKKVETGGVSALEISKIRAAFFAGVKFENIHTSEIRSRDWMRALRDYKIFTGVHPELNPNNDYKTFMQHIINYLRSDTPQDDILRGFDFYQGYSRALEISIQKMSFCPVRYDGLRAALDVFLPVWCALFFERPPMFDYSLGMNNPVKNFRLSGHKSFTDWEIEGIRLEIASGVPLRELKQRHKCTKTTIYRIKNYRCYSDVLPCFLDTGYWHTSITREKALRWESEYKDLMQYGGEDGGRNLFECWLIRDLIKFRTDGQNLYLQ